MKKNLYLTFLLVGVVLAVGNLGLIAANTVSTSPTEAVQGNGK